MTENHAEQTQDAPGEPFRYDRIKTRVNMLLNTYPNPEPAARGYAFPRHFYPFQYSRYHHLYDTGSSSLLPLSALYDHLDMPDCFCYRVHPSALVVHA